MGGNVVTNFLVDWYIDIYTNVYGLDTTYSDILLKFNGYLKHMVNTMAFKTFSNVVLALGLLLMIFYFFTDLTEKATLHQLSTLQMGKSFCLLFGTGFILFHTKQIFIFMLTMVESLNSSIAEASMTSPGAKFVTGVLESPITKTLLSRCVTEHFSTWSILGYALLGFVLTLISVATRVCIVYFSATRIIQLFIYYIFAPIGMADVFEYGPSGRINSRSSGFMYMKTMLAIMLQIVVITVICQSFSTIALAINMGYFKDNGEVSIEMTGEAAKVKQESAVMYPIRKFEYTDHKASVREIVGEGVNKVTESIKALYNMITDSDVEVDETQTEEKLKDDEKYKLYGHVINAKGEVIKSVKAQEEAEKIMNDSKYRMTIESTENFFDWCIGSSGGKVILLIILMITKVLMIISASKLCNYIVGTSI